MRLFLALLLALLALPAQAASGVVVFDTGTIHVKTCPSDGTTTPTVALTAGRSIWVVTVHGDETVFLCKAATCATGGLPLVHGTQLKVDVSGTVSCRSESGAGVLTFVASAL